MISTDYRNKVVTMSIDEYLELEAWKTMCLDFDRNRQGRHEGDADYGDPSGVSRGNELLPTGCLLGYGLGGRFKYVMPSRDDKYDIKKWKQLNK